MTDKRYTIAEYEAAWDRAMRDRTAGCPEVIAELTRPEIGPDVVVTYDWQGRPQGVTTYRHLRNVDATNIMPHYPEDKVLEWIDEWRFREGTGRVKGFVQAKMAAFKRGEG